jgi:hypothetical protein
MLAVPRKELGIISKWNSSMKNIFLLGFTGGSCGDFLCSKISQDDNFYSLQSAMTQDINRCELGNPFSKFGIDIKNPQWGGIPIISKDTYDNIDKEYSEKSLILPIHYFSNLENIKLPRLVGVKLCSKELTPLFYILLWIKRWSNKNSIIGNEENIIKCAGKNLKLIEKSKEIINRGFYYSFEQPALRLGVYNSVNIATAYFSTYRGLSKKSNIGWNPYDIDNLFLNTKQNIREFSQLFNTSQEINAGDIIDYHAANIALVEKHFNKSYSNLISGNWLLDLQAWVEQQCPNAYCLNLND